MGEREKALLDAAAYAEMYAEERLMMGGDTILMDPVFSGGRSPQDFARSQDLMIEGCINSAAYHAATHIAEHLRRLASTPKDSAS